MIECRAFLSASVGERREFVMKSELCLFCLQPGHIAGKCPSAALCHHCSKKHHSLLHFDNKENKQQEVRIGCTSICENSSKSAYGTKVVLVDIALASNPEHSQSLCGYR